MVKISDNRLLLGIVSMDWVENEFLSLNLSDKRLNKRAKKLMKTLSDTPENSIPAACKSWSETKAAYRFFDNDAVTAKKILKPHRRATLERIKHQDRVLLIEDTTTLNYSGQVERDDIGPIQQDNVRGIFLHPMLAVTPNKVCLGIVDYQQWARKNFSNTSAHERKLRRKTTPLEEKESFRWLQGYKKANKLAKAFSETKFVYMADREGDIYDIFHEAQKSSTDHSADWVIRALFNRKTINSGSLDTNGKLKEQVLATQPLGEISFNLPTTRKRKGRHVKQNIYAKRLTLSPPREKSNVFSSVEITALIAKEVDPPSSEKPVEWVLLSNVQVSNLDEASQIIQWYLCRWQIEIFFKVLKSGCKIEQLQLNGKNTFDPCLAMYLIVAWRILYLTMLGRTVPSITCEAVLESTEWQTAYIIIKKKPPPKEPPTLEKAILLIAQLGGFLARKSDGFPGTKVMWQGLQNLSQYIMAREAIEAAYGHTYG